MMSRLLLPGAEDLLINAKKRVRLLITPGVFLVVFAAVAVVVAATAAVAINVAVAANAAIAANIALGLNVAINVNVAANINVAGWDNENIFKAYGKFFGGKSY